MPPRRLPRAAVTGEAVPIPPAPSLPSRPRFFHPLSGALILGIDVLAFGGEVAVGFLDTVAMCVAAFFLTLIGVYLVQARMAGDRPAAAFGKAFLGAFAAGLPFSIAGTLLGSGILVLAGIHPHQMAKKAISR